MLWTVGSPWEVGLLELVNRLLITDARWDSSSTELAPFLTSPCSTPGKLSNLSESLSWTKQESHQEAAEPTPTSSTVDVRLVFWDFYKCVNHREHVNNCLGCAKFRHSNGRLSGNFKLHIFWDTLQDPERALGLRMRGPHHL